MLVLAKSSSATSLRVGGQSSLNLLALEADTSSLAHYKACLYAGVNISGTNAEVMRTFPHLCGLAPGANKPLLRHDKACANFDFAISRTMGVRYFILVLYLHRLTYGG